MLVTLELRPIILRALELADAVRRFDSWIAEHGDEGEATAPDDCEETLVELRRAIRERAVFLDRIEKNANHLKRALGATGNLRRAYFPNSPRAKWELFDDQFETLTHPEKILDGFTRLALAAVDLSGFAADASEPTAWQERGVRLLREGYHKVWSGTAATERPSKSEVESVGKETLTWLKAATSNANSEPGAETYSIRSDHAGCVSEGYYPCDFDDVFCRRRKVEPSKQVTRVELTLNQA